MWNQITYLYATQKWAQPVYLLDNSTTGRGMNNNIWNDSYSELVYCIKPIL